MKCPLCNEALEEIGTGYCRLHGMALENVKRAFQEWKNAYEDLSFADFLNRVIKLQGTGQKCGEVAEFLRQNPGRL